MITDMNLSQHLQVLYNFQFQAQDIFNVEQRLINYIYIKLIQGCAKPRVILIKDNVSTEAAFENRYILRASNDAHVKKKKDFAFKNIFVKHIFWAIL